MSSNYQETKNVTNSTENKSSVDHVPSSSKDGKPNDNKDCRGKKKISKKLFKSYLFYFLLATGSVVSSYFLWKKYGKKH